MKSVSDQFGHNVGDQVLQIMADRFRNVIREGDLLVEVQVVVPRRVDAAEGAEIVVLPELCLTGYSCGDLFGQRTLLQGALKGLGLVAEATARLGLTALVGLPTIAISTSVP